MFGQPSFGGFGQQPQSQPAFGSTPSSSPFGGTSAFGAQPSPFGVPAGGTSGFGASQPAFGAASTPAFGAQQSQGGLFGGSAFGAKPAGGFSFGSTPAFGATSQPAFGAAQSSAGFGAFGGATSTPAFGAPASTPAFGAATTPAFGGFGASSTPAFGATTSTATPGGFGTPGSAAGSPFGTPGSATGFGAPASGGFGAAATPGQQVVGTKSIAFQKTAENEAGSGTTAGAKVNYNSITAMPQYVAKSFEELRYEDYASGVKNKDSAPAPAAAATGFGAPQAATTPTGFGFGASSTPAFGASSTGSVFGQASTPAPFGASSTPAFGSAAPSPFGATGGFGASTPPSSTPAFGGFGATPAAGGGLFGAAASTPAASSFSFGGASSTSGFGTSSSPAFGAPSTPAFGSTAFGAPSSGGLFGSSSTPAFGSTGGFGAPSAPAFGTPSSSPFGTPAAPAAGAFGAPAATGGGFNFNTPTAAKPAGGFAFGSTPALGAQSTGSLFGGSSAPAFGAATGSLFGSTPASAGGSAFGGSAFGAAPATGGLFGAPAAPAATGGAFSFSPAGATQGGFGAAAAPVQPPSLNQQPYGTLQALPQISAPEQAVSAQRPVRPSVTTTRPSLRLTPRTAMPKFGLGASGGMGRGGSAAKHAAGNSAYVLSSSPGSGATAGGAAGSPAAAMLLPARDNPHRLFIRSPPPSTASAGNGSSLSPARGGREEDTRTPVRMPQQQQQPRSAEAPTSNGLHHRAAAAAVAGASPQQQQQQQQANGTPPSRSTPKAPPPAAAAADGGADDGGLVPQLGALRQEGYSMRPSERELQAKAARDPSALQSVMLVIEREGYGRLEWLEPVDVTGLDLQDLVQIDRGSVAVYYSEDEAVQKPPVGSGLNKPCRVVLTGVHKKNKPQSDAAVISAFSAKLKRYCSNMGARFLSYEPAEGVWTFEVDHFSRYQAPMDSDDEDDVGDQQQQQQQMDASGSGAQGTASGDHEATLGFGQREDADMQAETDDADTQQQQQQQQLQQAAAAGFGGFEGFEGLPLQHMLPGLLGHDAGALLEQKGAFFRRGGAVAGGVDMPFFNTAAAAGRGGDVTTARLAAAAPPARFASTFGEAEGRQGAAGGRSAYDASVRQVDRGFGSHSASMVHNWVRKRPALLQPPQQQQRRRSAAAEQQRALVSLAAGDEQQQQHRAAAAAGSALLVKPVSPQDLQQQMQSAAAAGSLQQQLVRAAAVSRPLLPPAAAISSSAAAVDAALMLGRSFRAGWGPNGQLAVPFNARFGDPFVDNVSPVGFSAPQQQQQQQSPVIELRQLQPLAAVALPGSAAAAAAAAAAAGQSAAVTAAMQQRILSGLQLHLGHSQPAAGADDAATDEDAAAAPAWRLCCDDKAVRMYVHSQLSNLDAAAAVAAVAAEDGGGGRTAAAAAAAAAEAAGCSQQVRELWLLLQLLFEYIEGQDDDLEGDDTAAAAAAGNGDADMAMDSSSNGSGSGGAKQWALVGMQRKAALSKWLQHKLRPQVMAALEALQTGRQQQQKVDVLWAVLHLLAGHQVKAAVALAASVGDVRLASLLACVNTAARGQHAQQLMQQIQVWRATQILPAHISQPRQYLLVLLTAAAGMAPEQALVDVATALGLDWSGALGLWLWFKVPSLESLPSTITAFTAALTTQRQLSRPVPPHAADPAVLLQPDADGPPAKAAAGGSGGSWALVPAGSGSWRVKEQLPQAAAAAITEGRVAAVADGLYCLLQLAARGCRNLGSGMLDTGGTGGTHGGSTHADVDGLVSKLLRPAGHTANPLDYSSAWQLLQVLQALGKLPEDESEYEVTSSAIAAGLISQLLLLGPEAVPWTAFVALHITHKETREAALQQLLQVTAPTWVGDASVVAWLRDTLGLPLTWIHTAQAVWYGSRQRPALALLHLIAAGSWQEAHRLACAELLPHVALATLPSSSSSSKAGAVMSVLWDFVDAAEAFLATAHPDAAAAAARQAAAAAGSGGGWEGVPEDASLADGFGGNFGAQTYCGATAAYVAAACRAAAAAAGGSRTSPSAAAAVAGVTLRAVCSVFAVQENPLGSAWTLGGGVYGGWCASFLGPSGRFVDPALAALVASEGVDTAAAAAAAMDEEVEGVPEGVTEASDVLAALQAATQRCVRLANALADAAAAAAAGGGSWWAPPAARLALTAMTAAVGRALVRLGVSAANTAAGGSVGQLGDGMGQVGQIAQWQGQVRAGPVGQGGVPLRGLLMMGGGRAGGPALAAAAVSCVGA